VVEVRRQKGRNWTDHDGSGEREVWQKGRNWMDRDGDGVREWGDAGGAGMVTLGGNHNVAEEVEERQQLVQGVE